MPTRPYVLLVLAAICAGCFGKTEMNANAPREEPGKDDGFSCKVADVGRVTLHRLNRAEYDNTVRDLLEDASRPARDFPADDSGYGFDNNGDVLSLAPLLFEKYEAAAERLVQTAWAKDFTPALTFRVEAEAANVEGYSAAYGATMWVLLAPTTLSRTVTLPEGGRYVFSARAFGQLAGGELPKLVMLVDGAAVGTFDVSALEAAPQIYAQPLDLTAGPHTLAVQFPNDYYNGADPDPANRDRNLVVDWFQVERPAKSVPPAQARLRTCDPSVDTAACAQQILSRFGRRAWRRALTPPELDRLVSLVQLARTQGDDAEQGLQLALKALLLSPHFLFRVELDADPRSPNPHPLSDFELASRLSYFLWSSAPDDALLDAAQAGGLAEPEKLAAQVKRLLADPRAAALTQNFAGQWLALRGMDTVAPNPTLFPTFDAPLRAAMKRETELVFQAFLDEGLDVRDLLDADFTFVNERLAAHYGLPGVTGPAFRRVSTAGSSRGGLLTHGSLLTLTSQPTRTSPVKRGKFVLGQLMCREPAPPPPTVEANLPTPAVPTGTLRQQMEEHRKNPGCASCHVVMDAIGFGMEGYDAIGRFRTEDLGFKVDATGALPGGAKFDGTAELSKLLKADPGLPTCVAQQLFTYGLGRGMQAADECALERISTEYVEKGASLTELLLALTRSAPFTQRRGEPEGTTP